MNYQEIVDHLKLNGYKYVAVALEKQAEIASQTNDNVKDAYAHSISNYLGFTGLELDPLIVVLSPEFSFLKAVAMIIQRHEAKMPLIDVDVVLDENYFELIC